MTRKEFLKRLETMKSVPYTKNPHEWGLRNVITNFDEFKELMEHAFSFKKLKKTRDGGISVRGLITNGVFWSDNNRVSKVSKEFILVYGGRIYPIIFRPELMDQNEEDLIDENGKKMTGGYALNIWRSACKKELAPYAMRDNDEILEVKNTIQKYNITLTDLGQMKVNSTLENCFHIDINSAFPAGVVATHPEFKDFFEFHFERRKTGAVHKAIMNYSIGAAQSLTLSGNRYPELARDAIKWTNDKLKDLTRKLRKQNYTVIGYNTDGIFVQKNNPSQPFYTDEDQGPGLGQWKIDHVFDKLRFKSAGSYEYIEDGKYHPVVRGATLLDKVKPRTEWEWGDIYNAVEVRYLLNEETNNFIEVILDGQQETD